MSIKISKGKYINRGLDWENYIYVRWKRITKCAERKEWWWMEKNENNEVKPVVSSAFSRVFRVCKYILGWLYSIHCVISFCLLIFIFLFVFFWYCFINSSWSCQSFLILMYLSLGIKGPSNEMVSLFWCKWWAWWTLKLLTVLLTSLNVILILLLFWINY